MPDTISGSRPFNIRRNKGKIMAWTEDRVSVLSKLWAEGLSASQIATQLGGVTRNAVIGKVHRLGLSGRATPSRPSKRKITTPRATAAAPKTVIARAPRPAPAIAPAPPPIEAKRMADGEYATILTITEDTCKWPLGDPSGDDFRFCGRNTNDASPYCQAHSRVAYQPARRRGATQKSIANPTRRALN